MAFWTQTTPGTRDPKRDFRFLLQVPGVAEPWAVKSAAKPNWTVGETPHNFINHKFKFPGRITWSDVQVVLVDPIEPYDTTLGVMQWLKTAGYRIPTTGTANEPYSLAKSKAVFNNPEHRFGAPNGQGPASGGNFVLKQIDAEGNSVDEWTLFNAWIKGFSVSQSNYESDNMQQITLTIAYDYANYEHKLKQVNTAWKEEGVPINDYTIPGNKQ